MIALPPLSTRPYTLFPYTTFFRSAWPVESVTMMYSIADAVERDPAHGDRVHFTVLKPDPTTADALSEAAKTIASTVSAAAIICFTSSGSTARRVARDRHSVPILMRLGRAHVCTPVTNSHLVCSPLL